MMIIILYRRTVILNPLHNNIALIVNDFPIDCAFMIYNQLRTTSRVSYRINEQGGQNFFVTTEMYSSLKEGGQGVLLQNIWSI